MAAVRCRNRALPRAGDHPRTIDTTYVAGDGARTGSQNRAGAGLCTAELGDLPELRPIGTDGPDVFIRRGLRLLFAGVALVYLALCGNVCSLLLSHLSSRQREFATCAALGASRLRLIRQAALEHTAIGMAGAAAGVGLAWLLTMMIPDLLSRPDVQCHRHRPSRTRDGGGARLDLRSRRGTGARVAGNAIGADRSIRASRQAAGDAPTATRWLTRSLLTTQIALACALLTGSAILVRSFIHLAQVDRGVTLEDIVVIDLGGLDNAFARGPAMALGTAAIEENVKSWPEVRAVALSREVPPSWADTRVRVDPSIPFATATLADRYRVNEAFFDLYAIRIVHGRRFDPSDGPDAVIVSERLAALLWPGRVPLHQTFEIGKTPGRVIGVAREITLPTSMPTSIDRSSTCRWPASRARST